MTTRNIVGCVAVLVASLSSAQPSNTRGDKLESMPGWSSLDANTRNHLRSLLGYRLTVDTACAISSVLDSMQASGDDDLLRELKAYDQVYGELQSTAGPDQSFAALRSRFPRITAALDKSSVSWRDLVHTRTAIHFGNLKIMSMGVEERPPFSRDPGDFGAFLWEYGDAVQGCGMWEPPLASLTRCKKDGPCELVYKKWSDLRDSGKAAATSATKQPAPAKP